MTEHTITLSTGAEMPLLGFGTWQLQGQEAYDSVLAALEVGYRHIDTATGYGNEREVGRAIKDSGVPRDDIFITTKLPPDNAGKERETIAASLRDLGVDQVDLWLVHWPPGGKARPETWKEFLAIQADGLTKAAGVSNYSAEQIDELVKATGTAPAVNQIKWTPRIFDPERAAHLKQNGVVLEGYSPFRAGDLNDPVLAEIAQQHGVTPAQVILRWHIDRGFVVIPKSAHRERIAANFDVFGFSLNDEELARIDGLSTEA
ncbi:MAG TPA: aldo/keto reductase [Mycobacteriales bacterium]|nr:aldo/keto reductase [Mycobacteriales bacterium]